jgi:hypothetical protein
MHGCKLVGLMGLTVQDIYRLQTLADAPPLLQGEQDLLKKQQEYLKNHQRPERIS